MSDIFLMNDLTLEIHVAGRFPAVTAGVTRYWWQENNVHLHSGVTIKTLGATHES